MKRLLQHLCAVAFTLGFATYVNATSYTIKFVNTTPYDVKFYELTVPANQATPQNFSNYITPGTTIKKVADGNSYTFTTDSDTDSIYMIITQISQSLIKPLKFNVSSFASGTLTITSDIDTPFITISIQKGSTIIVSEKYLKQLTM